MDNALTEAQVKSALSFFDDKEELLSSIENFKEDAPVVAEFLSEDESEVLNQAEKKFLLIQGYFVWRVLMDTHHYRAEASASELDDCLGRYYPLLEKDISNDFLQTFIDNHSERELARFIFESVLSFDDIRDEYAIDILFALCAVAEVCSKSFLREIE